MKNFLMLILLSILNLLFTRWVLYLSIKYSFFDKPNLRSEHQLPVSRLGGVAMSMSLAMYFTYSWLNQELDQTLWPALLLIVLVGLLDDLKGTSPKTKIFFQSLIAAWMCYKGLGISSLNGLFFIQQLSPGFSFFVTLLFSYVIINAFNLIDGINGLASMLSIANGIVLFFSGLKLDSPSLLLLGILLIALYGSFLVYNYHPAKIFMGDTGSLLSGTLNFIGFCMLWNAQGLNTLFAIRTDVLALGIVFIPCIDVLRVFLIRLLLGFSPFTADKRHLHHILTGHAVSHEWAALIIVLFHFLIVIFSVLSPGISLELRLFLLVVLFCLTITFFIGLRLMELNRIRKVMLESILSNKSPNPFYLLK